MMKRLVAALAVTAAALSSTSAAADAPRKDPLAGLGAADRALVQRITGDPTVSVPTQTRKVTTSLAVYDFLVDQLEVTGRLVEQLGLGSYEIRRQKDGRILVDDRAGAVAQMRQVIRATDEGVHRRLYLAQGHFLLPFRRKLSGDAVIELRYRQLAGGDAGRVVSSADIHFRAGTESLHRLGRGLRRLVSQVLRKKSTLFVKAAVDVSEATTKDPRRIERLLAADPRVSTDLRARFSRLTSQD